ncbi:DUF6503 family protein [Belliella marina]|uniref:DUF6503 family protein n=1 Tax=Belliella marina TaxID=1644146 RepID=A0ABW4VTW2_9BACT
MKVIHKYIPFIVMLAMLACETSPSKKAEKIIEESLDFHDPESAWDDLEKFSVLRTVEEFDESGKVSKSSEFQMEFRLKPFFEAKNSWEKDSIKHIVTFDGLKTKYLMGENDIQNEGFLAGKEAEIKNAFLAFTMPFGITGNASKITYGSKIKLMDEKEVETVEVIFAEEKIVKPDVYSCYFLPGTNEFIGYKLKNKNGFAVSNTVETIKYRGIDFPSKREVYEADSLGNHVRLREIVSYSFID